MIVHGREIAEEIMLNLEEARTHIGRPLALGILMGAGDAATESFIRIKARSAARLGVEVITRELSTEATTEDALAALAELATKSQGLLVQLPLPAGIDAERVLAALSPEKDVDAMGPKPHHVLAPVSGAIREVLERAGVTVSGKGVVVVGAGRLVGKPAAEMLTEMGANISFVTLEVGSLEALKTADIVILGAGSPGLVRPEMLSAGVVLIDAGTSESTGGKLVGDADPACANMASVFTPVPGGIGPIAVAMIFRNLFALVELYETK